MGSFRSWAVSTRIRSGPLGQSTATKSQIESIASTVQTVQSGKNLIKIKAINADITIK